MARMNPNDKRNWIVYKITSPSGRIYIGRTFDIKNRVRQYRYYAHNQFLSKSISKYGFDAHKFEQIDSFFEDLNYANGKEIFWIRSYMANVLKYPEMNGMNLTDGGEGSLGFKQSEERKLAVSRQMKGNKYSLGVKRSKDAIEKTASKLRGRKYDQERKERYKNAVKGRSKPVDVFNSNGDLLGSYESCAEAARSNGISAANICNCLKGKLKSTKGLFFKFKL